MAGIGIAAASISPPRAEVNAKAGRRDGMVASPPAKRFAPRRYVYLLAAFAAAAVLFSGPGCRGGGEAGGRGKPGELKDISADDYDKLVSVGDLPDGRREAGAGGGGDVADTVEKYELSGALGGKGDKEAFEIDARHDEVEVVFEWPEGDVDFWVKVYGKDGGELGDFDLDNGDIIQLFGGGRFTLEIYSREGRGAWRATYED
jgi:hypothetical protein